MKIALIGYGKMGRMIDGLASEFEAEVSLRIEEAGNSDGAAIRDGALGGVDAAIEFTHPDAVLSNLKALAEAGVPTVCGTTGWYDHLATVRDWFTERQGTLIWAPNFSIGVILFEKVVSDAAALFQDRGQYGAFGWEWHHDQKKDAPSGTMLSLVEAMRRAGYDRPVDVASTRAGRAPGTHEIAFDSAADTITLRHAARSREGFARGALEAARLAVSTKGVHSFSELLLAGGSS
jgi:4-hydroxy-tetrahydrodipicolinate reductase